MRIREITDDSLFALFPQFRGWVYLEPNNNKTPIDEEIKSGGKWVAYGTIEYVENTAKKLKAKIGREIDSIKYSLSPVKITPNAADESNALVVYCHQSRKDDVRNMLDSIGVKNITWKEGIQSLLELLQDPSFCFALEVLNPERLKYLSELAGVAIKPEIMEYVQGMNKFVDDSLQKMKEFKEKLKSH